MPEVYTLRDVAKKAQVGFRTVQRHVAEGRLKTSMFGKHMRMVSPVEFERWFAREVAK
jgi:hypothetical protein